MEPIPETTEAIEEFGPFTDADLLQGLQDRSERVTELVPDCVGISLGSVAHGVTLTLVATDREVAVLDGVRYLFGGPSAEGPAAHRALERNEGDVLDELVWQYYAQATAAAAVASTLTLPVLDQGAVVGSVTLYAASTSAFAGLHGEIAEVFDAWAPGAVTNADLSFSTREAAQETPRKLRADLDIQVAVGILAASRSVSLDDARHELAEGARRAGVGEAELAVSIIEISRDQHSD